MGRMQARRPSWGWLFLAGPVIWFGHFWVVYLAAEWGCEVAGDFLLLGRSGVAVITVALTAAGLGVIVWYTMRAWGASGGGGDDDQPAEFSRAGLILGVIFAVGVVFVGGPALVLTPC